MSQLFVDNIKNRTGGAIGAPSGAVVTGVVTATSFSGSGASLTGIDATALKDSGGSVKVQANTSGIVVTGIATATTFSGNITGTTGTFSGNVSVGGTLTYEDVTNVDSVGVITARSGIRIGAGQSVSAVSGIVTYYGDGSKLSGIESGVANIVASGAIGNGYTVIIKTDGTAGIVTETVTGPNVGSAEVYNNAVTFVPGTEYDSNHNRIVVGYRDAGNAYYGTAKVGTVNPSNNSITFGSPVIFNSGDAGDNIAVTYDSQHDRVVISYNDNGNSDRGTSVVGEVNPSNNSITFGSEYIFYSSTTYNVGSTYNSTDGEVIISYRSSSSTLVRCGTVNPSNNSISFGTQVSVGSGNFNPVPIYDSTNQRLALLCRNGNGRAFIASISGGTPSFGSVQSFGSSNVTQLAGTFDSTNGKVIAAYRDGDNNSYGTVMVGTINASAKSIAFGSATVFNTGATEYISMAYNSTLQNVAIVYRDNINGNGTVVDGTVDPSNNTISVGSETVLENDNDHISSAYDSTNDRVVISLRDGGNSNKGTSFVYQSRGATTNLTAENYIGIAAEAIANGATGKINILGGVNSGQTGLTTAQTYFVQNNGSLATSAGDPSVVAGTSISSTKILIR